jgi:LmbE family N-acetylglucosaminyl deacetylase
MAQTLPQDRGAAGTWQKLLKLRTTASVLHTTAHPDDEDGGLLAWLSRGQGARVGLLTLNRGEGGDDALGPELFDALGLIRTEELRVAGRYYGLDNQYYTTVIDYGFSKRLDEAFDKWGHDDLLRDVVRIIRKDRPFVLVSRFQGTAQDGHGNHQAAGRITREAFEAAGDPDKFPEQIQAGLRPWKPLKLYTGTGFFGGGAKATFQVDVGVFSPWLGDSYANFARLGLRFQRSQNGGSFRPVVGPWLARYNRAGSHVEAPETETSLFESIDTTIPGMFSALKRPTPEGAKGRLIAIDREVKAVVEAFSFTDPSACVLALARGLKATREAMEALRSEPDAVFVLKTKEEQFQDAINAALAVEAVGLAQPSGVAEPTGPFALFAPPPVMGPVVPGQTFDVRLSLSNRGKVAIRPVKLAVDAPSGWRVTTEPVEAKPLEAEQTTRARATIVVPDDARVSRSYFARRSIDESRYTLLDDAAFGMASDDPPVRVRASYQVEGVPVQVVAPVHRREANLPYGHELRELEVVPALAVNVSPRQAIVPLARGHKGIDVRVEIFNNKDGGISGALSLDLPEGWTADPTRHPFEFVRAGERSTFAFAVSIPSLEDKTYEITATAAAGGKEYREGYDILRYRDLETRYLYHSAICRVRGVDVKVAPELRVGYVMGIGDQVPDAIAQLGARVELLGASDLAGGDLGRFDAIVTGTRAYAVREDLRTNNRRLLDYAKAGGHLIVLYNTPEFVPDHDAPFPAKLPGNAEETSEEDASVEILAPGNTLLKWPNTIGPDDFQGWVEQRGSKFLAAWDDAYTPLVSTHDRGQAPQKGVLVTARCGEGHYTYCALALHRQLPYGVPGAYRLLANLLSLGKAERR